MSAERAEAIAAKLNRSVAAALDKALAEVATLRAERDALRAELDALFDQARIVLYDPVDTLAYPIEHNPYVIEKATRSPMTKDSILRTIRARIASREKT